MAISKPGYVSFDSWVGYAEEATFGTAIADDSNFTIFKTLDNNTPGFEESHYTDNVIKNQGKNMADIDDYFDTVYGQFQRYNIPPSIASSTDLKHMLYAATQAVSEGEATPYVATYTMNGATKPTFSSNEGYFFTLMVKEPFAAFTKKLTSCVLESLTVTFSPENGGRPILSGTVLSGRAFVDTSTPAGTNAHSTSAVPSFFNATSTLQINSQDLVFYNVSFTINNVFDWIGNTSGYAEDYCLVRQNVTANAVVKYDSNSDALANGKGATAGLFDFDIGTSAAAGFFSATCNDAWCTNVTYDRGGTDTVQKLNLSFELLNDYGNTQYVVFTAADAVDATW